MYTLSHQWTELSKANPIHNMLTTLCNILTPRSRLTTKFLMMCERPPFGSFAISLESLIKLLCMFRLKKDGLRHNKNEFLHKFMLGL